MKIKVLGSAAAECIPALWCECALCGKATARGGKEIRRRTSYAIDRDILVDFGPDIFEQSRLFGVSLPEIRFILSTHAHNDHINPRDLGWRRSPDYSEVNRRVRLLASEPTLRQYMKILCEDGAAWNFDALKIDPVVLRSEEIYTGDDFTLLPLPADHAPGSFIFLLERGGKRLLFANDTGFPPPEVWEALAKLRLDAVIAESTMAFNHANCHRWHMGVETVVRFRQTLTERGIIGPETFFAANHFSHNGGALHDELEAYFAPHNIATCFDGMEITL